MSWRSIRFSTRLNQRSFSTTRDLFSKCGDRKKWSGAKSRLYRGWLVNLIFLPYNTTGRYNRRSPKEKRHEKNYPCSTFCFPYFSKTSGFLYSKLSGRIPYGIDRPALSRPYIWRHMSSYSKKTDDHLFYKCFTEFGPPLNDPYGRLLFTFRITRTNPWFVVARHDLVNVFWNAAVVLI